MRNEIPESIAQNLLSLLPLFHKKLMRPSEDSSIQKGMSSTHFHILILLQEIGTHPISEIGKRLGISKPNMTPLVDKLVGEGLLERQPHPSDRRVINLILTEKGAEFLSEQKMTMVGTLKRKLTSLSDEDLCCLLSSLENIRNIISKITL